MGAGNPADQAVPDGAEDLYGKLPVCATLVLSSSAKKRAIQLDSYRLELNGAPEAYSSLVPYGLTSADAVLSQFVADERILRPAVADALVNSLDHPRYEYYYPWDYSIGRQEQIVANHRFIRELKRRARANFIAELQIDEKDINRFQKTLAAEDSYLIGFEQFQTGISLADQYRLFDAILAMAPWNDSLRARIFSQYSHIASSRRDPMERARLLKKARRLYEPRSKQR